MGKRNIVFPFKKIQVATKKNIKGDVGETS